MKSLDGAIQLASDVGDGLGGIRFAEHRLENITDLSGRNATQKSLQDQFVDRGLAALVARQNPRTVAFAGTWDAHPGETAETREEVAEVVAIAIIQAALRGVFVVVQLQMIVAFGFQGLLDQRFELGAQSLGHFRFKELFPLGKVQFKMAVAEDLQFSYQGVPPL